MIATFPNRIVWIVFQYGRIPDFPEQCVGKDGL